MIIIKVQSGLGNQMFQYAIGRHLAHINNTELKIDNNFQQVTKYKNNLRKYRLDCFNIDEHILTNENLKQLSIPDMNANDIMSRIKRKVYKNIENKKKLENRQYIKQSRFDFQPEILQLKDNVYLEGSWQTEKYFKDIEHIIKKDFTLKNKLSNQGQYFVDMMNKTQSVSIHIRRGDYATNKDFYDYYGLCSLEYYHKAIDIIKMSIKNPTFFIFSDDIQWVKNNLKVKSPMHFVSDNNFHDCEELIIMSKCQHNIIANSTFSWWSAWLNDNSNKIIIAPKIWLKNSPHDTSDVCPQSWIRI